MATGELHVAGHGPFAEIGSPTALDTSSGLVVVGGVLGPAQWNGYSPTTLDRTDPAAGQYPLAWYSTTLTCVGKTQTWWPILSVAIHPSGRFAAVGTGGYDGGYCFEGELLILDLDQGAKVSVLSTSRTVERVAWTNDQTLQFTLAPEDDWDVDDWQDLDYESFTMHHDDWLNVEARSISVAHEPCDSVPRPAHDSDGTRRRLIELAAAEGLTWELRRQGWALVTHDSGDFTMGSESRIEHWSNGDLTLPTWSVEVDGTCTQLVVSGEGSAIATVWGPRLAQPQDRTTTVLRVDSTTGDHQSVVQSEAAVLVARLDGRFLRRSTRSRQGSSLATIYSSVGSPIGAVVLGAYDLFNHYFDIRYAEQFLILVGAEEQPWRDKWVTEVRETTDGEWTTRLLFPLDWDSGRHLFGGPGVFLDDSVGRSIIQSGSIHHFDGAGAGDVFIVRRGYESGALEWHLSLNHQITAMDTMDGRIVAVTNASELIVVDATTGSIVGSTMLAIGPACIVPLSLSISRSGTARVGTSDGRVISVDIAHISE